MSDVAIPCTTPECASVKFFEGRCNPCTKAIEGNPDLFVRTTWVEECMAKQSQGGGVAPHEGRMIKVGAA